MNSCKSIYNEEDLQEQLEIVLGTYEKCRNNLLPVLQGKEEEES